MPGRLIGLERWQHFAQTAAHLGVGSSLSVHLPIDSETVAGSMNLYSKRQLHLDDERIAAALPYATQLAAAMESINAYRATATLAQNMAEAMRSRAVIEQAKGMLMSEKQISADDAFQALRSMSQKSNIKVRDVALRLVEGRSGIPQSLE